MKTDEELVELLNEKYKDGIKPDKELLKELNEEHRAKLISIDILHKFYHFGYEDAIEDSSEKVIDRAVDKLFKSKDIEIVKKGEWITFTISMEISGLNNIEYKCSNCNRKFRLAAYSMSALPKYCENCGSKNTPRELKGDSLF